MGGKNTKPAAFEVGKWEEEEEEEDGWRDSGQREDGGGCGLRSSTNSLACEMRLVKRPIGL